MATVSLHHDEIRDLARGVLLANGCDGANADVPEHVGGPGGPGARVALIPVDPARPAVFGVGPYDQVRVRGRDGPAEAVARVRVRGLEVGVLDPCRSRPAVDVGGSGVRSSIAELIPIDPLGHAALPPGADQDGVARDRHRLPEAVVRARIRGLQVGLLGPRGPGPAEHVGGPGAERGVVARVAIDAGRPAVLLGGAHHHRVPRHRHRESEAVVGIGVGGLEVGLLHPAPTLANEDVGRPREDQAVVSLVPVDPGGLGALRVGADDDRVATDGDGHTERVPGVGVGCLEVGLLGPGSAPPHEHVGRPRTARRVVVLVPVHPRRCAVLLARPHHEGVPRHGERRRELVVAVRIGGLDVRRGRGCVAVGHSEGQGEGCGGEEHMG